MIRIAGVILVMVSSSFLGFAKGQQLQERLDALKEIQKIFLSLLTDIQYGQTLLPESLERIAGQSMQPFSDILKKICVQMHRRGGKTLADIWKREMEQSLKNSALKPKEREALIRMGYHLGNLDRKIQVQMIQLYLKDLEVGVAEVTDSIGGQQKLCRMLGVAGGLLIVLLLL
ncbi:MAG: stage III sporulation protein AB [Lachnospiraceae bacterium]|nr:stage III sporulation protein AB [Lachnospiraceae bacterium]